MRRKASVTTMSDQPAKRAGRGRVACFILIGLAVLLLGYVEIGKPVFTEDAVLQPLITMTLTRTVGAVVFFAVLLYQGFRVLDPFRRPFLRSLLFSLPAFAVVIYNMPIAELITGQVTVVHKEPRYLVWFALESLAIGLFEEFAFRGVVLLLFAEKRRRTRKDLFLCILLSSAVFGGIHLVNLAVGAGFGAVMRQIGYSFLIGAMCSVVLYRTANIWICVLLHTLFDFCGGLIDTLGTGPQWDAPRIIITVLLAVAVGVYMILSLWRTDPAVLDRIFNKKDKEAQAHDLSVSG